MRTLEPTPILTFIRGCPSICGPPNPPHPFKRMHALARRPSLLITFLPRTFCPMIPASLCESVCRPCAAALRERIAPQHLLPPHLGSLPFSGLFCCRGSVPCRPPYPMTPVLSLILAVSRHPGYCASTPFSCRTGTPAALACPALDYDGTLPYLRPSYRPAIFMPHLRLVRVPFSRRRSGAAA